MASSTLEMVRRQWQHSHWADRLMLAAIGKMMALPPEALREYAHIVGAQENWLSRLVGRAPTLAIWPALTRDELASASDRAMNGYDAYLAKLDEPRLASLAHYTNTQGKTFDTPVSDILLHVPMHSQYHRGKVNLILRQAGLEPVPTDFISFVRGAPAAVTKR